MFTHAAALYACVSWHLVAGTVLMQERGDLHQDENGQWLEGEAIDWATLPVKVEGVIEKRIERLAGELKTILTIASVEGETFTAEVVARVQQLDQRTVVQQLSRELDKRHRLVTAQAVERLDSGQQRLSLYRFRHNLFQHYLTKVWTNRNGGTFTRRLVTP